MNKLLTKIASLSVGFAMAIGIGVAAGGKAVAKASALEVESTRCNLADTSIKCSGYGKEHTFGTYLIYGGQNYNGNWAYFKFGAKKEKAADPATVTNAYIKGTTAIADDIKRVGIVVSANSSVAGSVSATLKVASNADFTTDLVAATPASFDYTKAAEYSITPSSGTSWGANKYYNLELTCTNNSTSNGMISLSAVIFYYEQQGAEYATKWTVSDVSGLYPGRKANATVTATEPSASAVLPTLTYSSEDTDVFTVDASSGEITAVGAGSAKLYAKKSTDLSVSYYGTVTVDAFPAYGGITLNKYYVLTATVSDVTYELTNVGSGTGTTTVVESGVYAKSYKLKAVEGKYGNTLAFVTNTGYYFHSANPTSGTIGSEKNLTANSSWIVQYENGEYSITNSIVYGIENCRQLLFNSIQSANKINNYLVATGYYKLSFVEVTDPVTDFTIDSEKTMFVNTTDPINYSIIPEYPTDSITLSWSSSDEDIATVDNKGVVTAKAIGEATITASATIAGNPVDKTCALSVIDTVARHSGAENDPYNVSEAYYIAKGDITEYEGGGAVNKTGVFVKGLLSKVQTAKANELSIWLGDNLSQTSAATKGFEVYHAVKVYNQALSDRYANDNAAKAEFAVGATVIAKGDITLYNSTAEFGEGGEVTYSSYIEALTFARGFNTTIGGICVEATGNTDQTALGNAWSGQDTAYGQLEAIEKAHILEAASNKNGNDIEKMVAKYDYIVAKYNTSKTDPYNDFLGRIDSGDITLGIYRNVLEFNSPASGNSTIITIIIMSSVVVLGIGCYFFIRKKHRD